MQWAARPWHRPDPAAAIEVRTWTDPCPACGAAVAALDAEAITVVSNPLSVIGLHNPACGWDEDDPDSPDCICTPVITLAPDPAYDEVHVIGYRYYLRPCGHEVAGRRRFYEERRPEAGTLGALMGAWAALGEEE